MTFYIRIELQSVGSEVYDLLRSIMIDRGYAALERPEPTGKWDYPAGEFMFVSESTVDEVLAQVRGTLSAMRTQFRVVVTEMPSEE